MLIANQRSGGDGEGGDIKQVFASLMYDVDCPTNCADLLPGSRLWA